MGSWRTKSLTRDTTWWRTWPSTPRKVFHPFTSSELKSWGIILLHTLSGPPNPYFIYLFTYFLWKKDYERCATQSIDYGPYFAMCVLGTVGTATPIISPPLEQAMGHGPTKFSISLWVSSGLSVPRDVGNRVENGHKISSLMGKGRSRKVEICGTGGGLKSGEAWDMMVGDGSRIMRHEHRMQSWMPHQSACLTSFISFFNLISLFSSLFYY